MTEEPFLLVSLEEEKAKSLAQVLSNDTARKILDFLSKVEHSTETEISKQMKVPLSTVHYNLSLLVKTKLVSDEQFTYSEKGKQIIHYSLSNKYVIIAPKKSELLKEKLKKFLPVMAVSTVVSIGIKYLWNSFSSFSPAPTLMMEKTLIEETADVGARVASSSQEAFTPLLQTQEFALWFLFGSVFTLLLYFIWAEIIIKKIDKKQ